MTGSALQEYARGILTLVPWEHWVMMVVVSLALTGFLLIRKKSSAYGAIALGLTVFTGLVLVDTAVLIRHLGLLQHSTGHNLGFELDRLLHGSKDARSEVISNLIVFVPFGFFLTDYRHQLNGSPLGADLDLRPWQPSACRFASRSFSWFLRWGFSR